MTGLATRAARALGSVWRFNGLRVAERAFASTPPGTVLRRRLFGATAPLEVSRTPVHRLLYLEGERYVEERFLLQRLLKAGDIACDVGANIGYYLLLFEQIIGANGEVLCIEPEPDNLVDLTRTVEANHFTNVRIVKAACGDQPGTVRLARGINSGVTANGEIEVPMVTLDDVASPRTSFLKVDVEGFEGHVLAGARRLLRDARPTLFLEVHPAMLRAPYSPDAIVDMLHEWYGDISFYAPRPRSPVRQFAAHYLGRDPVEQISDLEALLAACRRGDWRAPFWLVASR